MEQEEVKPKPKELGSEQGDVRWSIGVLENGSWSSVGRCGTTSGWKIKYQRNIYHVSDLENTPFAENISEVRALATVVVAVHVNITLWVAVRPRRCIADELLSKMDVVRANSFSSARTRAQHLPLSVKVWV